MGLGKTIDKLKNCTVGLNCGFSCINRGKDCQEKMGGNAGNILEGAVNVIKSEGLPIAVGMLAGSVGGPVAGTLGTTGMRAAIKLGVQAHRSVSQGIADAAETNVRGLEKLRQIAKSTISDMRKNSFVRDLEKGTQGDIAYSLISNAVKGVVGVPVIGDVVALKTSDAAVRAFQKFQQRDISLPAN